jgi:hypothetical protein
VSITSSSNTGLWFVPAASGVLPPAAIEHLPTPDDGESLRLLVV